MQRTIKQWCKEFDIGWLGQGTIGKLRYDWKLVLGSKRSANFSSTVKGPLPELLPLSKRDVLIFPNVNPSKDDGKTSRDDFLRMLTWVEDCLDGRIRQP